MDAVRATAGGEIPRMESGRSPRRGFLGVVALLFGASATTTILGCASMSMGELPMPGGWSLSMAWMPMCGQTWLGSAVCFLGMWMAMMAAMMLPSLAPMLQRYRQAIGAIGGARLGGLTAWAGAGYFLVWAAVGLAVYPSGAAVAAFVMRYPTLARAVPLVAGTVVLLAGALQFTAWKARQLACCREIPARALRADSATARRHGLRLGFHCVRCCANLMAILLVAGVMDLGAMAAVTAALTLERLAPAGRGAARAIGAVATAAGLFLIVQAAGPG
jgi:predicted metal-binding membrane protein